MKCLYKDLRYRYFNARELADDITRYFDGEAVIAPQLTFFNRSVRRIRRSKKLFAIVFLFVLGFCSMLVSALLGYNSKAAALRNDLQTLRKSNYTKEDLLVKFPHSHSQQLSLQLQQQLEISIHNYLTTIHLLEKLQAESPHKKNTEEIRKLNQQLLELSQFVPQDKSCDYLYRQPANYFFKNDYDILLQYQIQDMEKDKRLVNDIMEKLRVSGQDYAKYLRNVIHMRSSFITAAMIGYANSSHELQQKLALDYLITVNMKYGKQNIKDILLENLRNIEVNDENSTKVKQLINALRKLRDK